MKISNLNYLEIVSQTSSVKGGNGNSSIEINVVDDKVKEKISGDPLKKKIVKDGSTTTYTYEGDDTVINISITR